MNESSYSPFLSLPGELHNRIYLYAVDVYDQKNGISLKPSHRSINSSWSPAKTSDWDLRRPTLALTQVCRQIRSEFLPLHRASACIDVALSDVKQYFKDHVLPGLTKENDATANIIISVSDTLGCSVDILDMVLLDSIAPGIVIRWDCINEDNAGFTPKLGTPTYTYFRNCMSRLEVKVRGSNRCSCGCGAIVDEVIVFVKGDHAQEWMDECTQIYVDHDESEEMTASEISMCEWARELGLLKRNTYYDLSVVVEAEGEATG